MSLLRGMGGLLRSAAWMRRGAGFVGAYDAFESSLAHVYEIGRRTLTSYTGDLVRLRRDSDDAEADFGADASGELDVAAIASWAGGASYIVTIYDQVGDDDVTNSTAAEQPLFVASGQNGKPVARFAGSEYLGSGATSTFRNSGGGSVYCVVDPADITDIDAITVVNNGTLIGSSRTTVSVLENQYSVGGRRLDADLYDGSNGGTVTLAAHLVVGRFDWANSDIYCRVDGAQVVSEADFYSVGGNTSDTDSLGIGVGASLNGNNALEGDVATVIIVDSASVNAALETAINDYWGVY